MLTRLIYITLLAFFISAPVSAQYIQRTTAYRTDQPIQVDGHLEEAAWKFTAPLGPFLTDQLAGAARYPTYARLLWDDDYLYVAFECEDRDIQAGKTRRDQRLWEDDVLIIVLDPDSDGKDYLSGIPHIKISWGLD